MYLRVEQQEEDILIIWVGFVLEELSYSVEEHLIQALRIFTI